MQIFCLEMSKNKKVILGKSAMIKSNVIREEIMSDWKRIELKVLK